MRCFGTFRGLASDPKEYDEWLKASRPLRIFLVEDHADSLAALCLYLKQPGILFGLLALKKIGEADDDVLISDIGLSDGNAWDLIREMGILVPNLPSP